MRQVEFRDETELEGELGRDLGEEVAREVAGGERSVPHEMEHCVRHLAQLTFAQVKTVVFFCIIASVHHLDDSPPGHPCLNNLGLAKDDICQVVSKLRLHLVRVNCLDTQRKVLLHYDP